MRRLRGLPVALAASLVLHAAFFAYLHWSTSAPDVGLEFQLPAEVEFGLTEAVDPVAAAPAASEAPADESSSGDDSTGGAPGAADAGIPEPETESEDEAPEEKTESPEETARAAAGEQESEEGEGLGTEALPPGAQLALRMDMKRIRSSPLSGDVRRLISTIPDWRAVLGDAGLEPVDELARLLIASPNLRRENVVIAGRHEGNPSLPRDIVSRMATARGEEASWSTERGVPTAPWPDRDRTRRIIALVGDHHFTISRPDDLPRVLAVAQARQAEQSADGGTPGAPDPDEWGEALLSMEEDEALTLEVEGAREFVRGPMADRFPERIRLAVVEQPNRRVKLTGTGTYASNEDARAALAWVKRLRRAYAGHLLTKMLGMESALLKADIEVTDDVLHVETELRLGQIRFLLGYVERSLSRGRRPRAPGPSSAGEPEGDEQGDPPRNPYDSP